MRLASLRIEQLRCIDTAALEFGPGGNLLLGPNGAGKTSVLEAVFLLSYGRSFRRGARDALIRCGAAGLRVVARLGFGEEGGLHRLGMERGAEGWRARVDEVEVARLTDLFQRCAVCCFEPGSHELIGGGPDGRRQFLDWGLFHVEPEFLPGWRRYQRALRQRNAGLRQGLPDRELEPWEQELCRSALPVTAARRRYLVALEPHFAAAMSALLPEAGASGLWLQAGHRADDEAGLALELASARAAERQRGTTRIGPHRADWQPHLQAFPSTAHLSRGQEKLVALAAVLAQAALHRQRRGQWPIVLLDDLASELDPQHQRWVLEYLDRQAPQVLVTGTEASAALADWAGGAHRFHVEHGQVRAS